MPFYNYRGSRESNVIHSELYKEIVLDYFSLSGYVKQSDSALEGCLTDLVLKNLPQDGDIETYIEIKWSEFSLNTESIRKEFAKYLLLYCRAPPSKKFKFFIIARKVINHPLHKAIFADYKWSAIEEICQKIEKDLEGEDLTDFKNLSKEELKEFFWSTSLVQADISDLKLKIAQKTGDYPIGEDPFLRYQNLSDEEKVLNAKENLIGNLVKITNFKKIYMAQTPYRRRKEVYNNIPHPSPFILYEGKLISLYPFDGNNPLNGIIIENSIEEIEVREWLEDADKRRLIIALLNRTGERLMGLRGLFKKRDSIIYYFPDYHREGEKELKWIKFETIDGKPAKRHCRRRIFKKYAERSKYPYYLHIAVTFRAFYFDTQLFYLFLPRKIFTSDGKRPVSAERAKILHRKYRNPQWSYNRNVLLEQLFWGFVIFLDPTILQKRLYFKDLRNEEIEKHIHLILQMLGLDNYFREFEINKRPKVEEPIQEDDESISKSLDSIFQIGEE